MSYKRKKGLSSFEGSELDNESDNNTLNEYFTTTKTANPKRGKKRHMEPTKIDSPPAPKEPESSCSSFVPKPQAELGFWDRLRGKVQVVNQGSKVPVKSNGVPVDIGSMSVTKPATPCVAGRVTNKVPIRDSGESQVFSFVLTDTTGSINVKAFNEMATVICAEIEVSIFLYHANVN